MAVLDANALIADASGLAFLADVLGTVGEANASDRRFPIEAWTPQLASPLDPTEASAPAAMDSFRAEMA